MRVYIHFTVPKGGTNMIDKRIIIGCIALAIIVMAYRTTMTFDCGPGCTTDPRKIAAGCRPCPTQNPAVVVIERNTPCESCHEGTEDFFHDSIYTPATQDI